MSEIKIEQVESEEDCLESWQRITSDGEEDIKGVLASKEDEFSWRVTIYVAEFIRDESVQSSFFEGITEALSGLPNVEEAFQEDREIWLVEGSVSGKDLVQTCSQVIEKHLGTLMGAL